MDLQLLLALKETHAIGRETMAQLFRQTLNTLVKEQMGIRLNSSMTQLLEESLLCRNLDS